MNAFRLMDEINRHLSQIGVVLPTDGFDFSTPGAKKIFLSALKTRVAAVNQRKAEKEAERQRERGADDPLARAYGRGNEHDEGELLGDPELVDEQGADHDGEREPSALDRFFQPKKRPTDEGDADAEPDDQRKRSALTRFLERKTR